MTGNGDDLGAELGQSLKDGITDKASEMAGGLRDSLTGKASEMAGGLKDDLTDSAEAMLRGVKGRAKKALHLDELGMDDEAVETAEKNVKAAAAEPANRIVDDAVGERRLDLHEEDRLPWLEAEDDDEGYAGVDGKRVFGFVLAGLALMATIVGGIWWGTHRKPADVAVADGSTIAAPEGDYKTAPKDPGGKTYAGTGDSSFAVSQGQHPTSHLAGGTDVSAVNSAANAAANATSEIKTGAAGNGNGNGSPMAPSGKPASAPVAHGSDKAGADPKMVNIAMAGAAAAGSGSSVQVGAFSSQASAEAAWAKLSKQYGALSGFRHRIVEGQADIGTVYRLQAITDGSAAATGLCAKLRAAGLACQVKR